MAEASSGSEEIQGSSPIPGQIEPEVEFKYIGCKVLFKIEFLNCKVDNWTFSEWLIRPFNLLKIYFFKFHTLAS